MNTLIADSPALTRSCEPSPTVHIEVEQVTFTFGERVVLTDFSTTLTSGHVTALVGPSGSGKSTLLAALSGFLAPKAGEIRIVRGNTVSLPEPGLVAWVPQGANALGARSVLDNVMIAPLAAGSSLADAARLSCAALEQVGMVERADDLARQLSGGELQRVGFARALASGKPMVFADEPTASLDEANTELIAELLHALRLTTMVVVATHDPILIKAAGAQVELRRHHG